MWHFTWKYDVVLLAEQLWSEGVVIYNWLNARRKSEWKSQCFHFFLRGMCFCYRKFNLLWKERHKGVKGCSWKSTLNCTASQMKFFFIHLKNVLSKVKSIVFISSFFFIRGGGAQWANIWGQAQIKEFTNIALFKQPTKKLPRPYNSFSQ